MTLYLINGFKKLNKAYFPGHYCILLSPVLSVLLFFKITKCPFINEMMVVDEIFFNDLTWQEKMQLHVCAKILFWNFPSLWNPKVCGAKLWRALKVIVCVPSCSVMSDSLRPYRLKPARLHLSMGILQARILEWVAMPSSRGSSQPGDWTQVSHIAGGFLTVWATREAQKL